MDDYLATRGLWRKPTARDKSCLFRAVSEQLFNTQALYQKVKQACDAYIKRNKAQLEQESKPHGQLDILALSRLYKRDFVIYREPGKPPVNITSEGYPDQIVLCFSGGHHYDSIYARKYIESAAICQSIVYEILYQQVFQMESPVDTSAIMINTRPNKPRGDVTVSTSPDSVYTAGVKGKNCDKPEDDHKVMNNLMMQQLGYKSTVPFPYKVAKALASDIYRNVELDVWIEARKELCVTETCVDEDEPVFSPGDKCRVMLEGRVLNVYIQEIEPEHGPTTVFVEELGEKHIVPISSLKPLPPNSKSGWSHSEDGQSSFRKRKPKKTFRDCYSMSSTEQELGSTSPMAFKANMKPEFGSQHIINAAGHPTKNGYGFPYRMRHHSGGSTSSSAGGGFQRNYYPGNQYTAVQLPRGRQRVRSYSESGATNGPVMTGTDDLGIKADSPHCRGAENEDPHRRVAYTPPPPRPESYGSAYPRLNEATGSPMIPDDKVFNQLPCNMPMQMPTGSPMIPPPQMPLPPQMPMLAMGASPAGPHQPTPPPPVPQQQAYPMRSAPVNNGMMNGVLPSQQQESLPVGAHVPYFPYLVIPHVDTIMGPVNYRAPPSADQRGVDLPVHDASTLRFFFNLGVEYYRLCSYITQPGVPQAQQVAAPAMYAAAGDVRYAVPFGYSPQMAPPTLVSQPPMEADYCGQLEGEKALVKDQHGRIYSLNHKTVTSAQTQYLMNINSMSHVAQKQAQVNEKSEATASDQTQSCTGNSDPVYEGTEVRPSSSPQHNEVTRENKHDQSTDSSDCPCEDSDKHGPHDSGCVSDASSGHGETTLSNDEPDSHCNTNQHGNGNGEASASLAEMTSQHLPDAYNDDDILELLRQPIFTRAPKYKPNKKNGPTKLVRPIKDIPPRFKKLLETEALAQAAALRKNQFEGAPLVRPIMMGRGRRHRNNEAILPTHSDMSQASFNPNAQCFIPGQPYQCAYEHSENGVNYVAFDPSSAVVEAGSSASCVASSSGSGSGDGSVVVSNTSTYTMQIVNNTPNSACSAAESYYCQCPPNSLCVSSSGAYYSSQQAQAAPGVGGIGQNTAYYPTY